MQSCFNYIRPTIYLFLSKFYNQDCILCRQSDQHNQPDLEVDVILQTASPYSEISSQCSNRQ